MKQFIFPVLGMILGMMILSLALNSKPQKTKLYTREQVIMYYELGYSQGGVTVLNIIHSHNSEISFEEQFKLDTEKVNEQLKLYDQ